jgi:hypothetical protein
MMGMSGTEEPFIAYLTPYIYFTNRGTLFGNGLKCHQQLISGQR